MSPIPAEWIPQLKIMAKKVNQIYFDESYTSRMDSLIGSISHKIPEPIICFEPGRLSPGEPPSTIQPLSIFLFNGALSPYTNVHMHPTCASDQQTNLSQIPVAVRVQFD